MAKKQLTLKGTLLRVLLYLVVIVVCIITLYPYFAMFCTALKSRAEIFSMNGTILPINALWSNFIDIWSRAPMANYMLNSLLIAGGSTLIAMLCGIPAAYALARMKFKGTDRLSGICHRFPDVRSCSPADRYLQGNVDLKPDRQYSRAGLHQCRV